jgi:ubiquinone/menaquinone biosynthesis C-methylase UbiE
MLQNPTPLPGRFVQPDVVSTHFHFREGDTVADFGAGGGFYVEILSKIVGQSGKLYALEIQKELVEKISDVVRKKGLGNVEPKWCDIEADGGVTIPDNTLDGAIMVNTFFQFEDKHAGLREVFRTLRSGGKFILIDWSESFSGLGPQPDQIVSEADAKAYVESVGFTFERSFDSGDHHYGLAFRKA